MPSSSAGTPLGRHLGVLDAVVIGLGAMIGAGVFSAIGAAAVAGPRPLLLGLGVAALVAYANATSSAQLAAQHPQSGGTYVYGTQRLGPFWGYLAGWSFVVGKTASCAAMAMTFAAYAFPQWSTPLAVGAVAALTLLTARGVKRTAIALRVGLVIVLLSLVVVVTSSLTVPDLDLTNLVEPGGARPREVLGAAGLLFFAFAGYARIATLGEEVHEPHKTIPRAIPIALGITLAIYVAVTVSSLAAVGADELARTDAALAVAADAGRVPATGTAVRVGGAVASLGVLLSLLSGVGRTGFAMARDGYFPAPLARVHPQQQVPHVAQYVVGILVVVAVGLADLREAIGFSSFGVLTYYAIANASALRLRPHERLWGRWRAALGLAGCAGLALSLPIVSVAGGAILLATGGLAFLVTRRRAVPRAD